MKPEGRFIVTNGYNFSLFIADYMFYTAHQDEIDEYLTRLGAIREGMVIDFDTRDDMMMFLLKWS